MSGNDATGILKHLQISHSVCDLRDIEAADLRAGDVAFLTTHGQWGEDGKLQGYLETLGISYTGPGVLGSAVSMHKGASSLVAAALGIRVPPWLHVTGQTDRCTLAEFVTRHGSRTVLRPISGGGSLGVRVVSTVDEMVEQLDATRGSFTEFLLNPFIEGTEITTARLEVDSEVLQLPALQTAYEGEIYDYAIKHDESLRTHTCPADVPDAVVKEIEDAAGALYAALRLRGFVRFDFIVDGDDKPWFLEMNCLPGLSRHGNLATMAQAHGLTYDQLVLLQLQSRGRLGQYSS